MGESFAADAAEMGYPPDWCGGSIQSDPGLDPSDVKEVTSDILAEDLIDQLISAISGDSDCDWTLYNECYKGDGFISISALDGANTEFKNLHIYYFKDFCDRRFSAKFFMEVLRDSGLPFLYTSNESAWVIWDKQINCIRVHHTDNKKSYIQLRERNRTIPPDLIKEARALLDRARITSDHGQKPLLINVGDEIRAKQGKLIEYKQIQHIPIKDFDEYLLAYVDRSGSIRSLPLSAATEAVGNTTGSIPTRACEYYFDHEGLYTVFDSAYLLSCAFLLAARVHPEALRFFKVLPSGTIYQPCLYAQPAPRIQRFSSFGHYEALATAEEIRSYGASLGQAYITSGLHPFDGDSARLLRNHEHLVTTAELYERAVRTLYECGMKVIFGSGVVSLKRRLKSEEQSEWPAVF